MESKSKYLLYDANGNNVAEGEAIIRLDEESISVLPDQGEALRLDYRDIGEISVEDYNLRLSTTTGEKLNLRHLGRSYEDIVHELRRLRNERILEDMLIKEDLIKFGVKAEYSHSSSNSSEISGICEVRIYETALVLLSETTDPLRVPFGNISKVDRHDYSVTVYDDLGNKLCLSKMGREFEPIGKAITERVSELSLKTQAIIKDLVPSASVLTLIEAAGLLRDGKSASRKDIDNTDPYLWDALEKRLGLYGIKYEYEFLKKISKHERMRIGIKRGLMGDLDGEYIWFLSPVYSTDESKLGNAVAMEAGSSKGGGRATYFFKISNRDFYRKAQDICVLDNLAEELMVKMNYCLQAVNFRREPVYLANEKLNEPAYAHYRYSVARLPELRTLRDLFIGRVIHHSPEQWARDVEDLLLFNISESSETAKWEKGKEKQ